ncbi:hypothetical protein LCGC14_2292000 [marine sediment metagenome]|uniref:Uncharacterized protein n=1 Tax=marine sediment metagenome TaxID=412755 RepID=A0A0F9F3J1_9ZZZZ
MTKRELLKSAQEHTSTLAEAIGRTDVGLHPMILEDLLIALEQQLGTGGLETIENLIAQRRATGTWS